MPNFGLSQNLIDATRQVLEGKAVCDENVVAEIEWDERGFDDFVQKTFGPKTKDKKLIEEEHPEDEYFEFLDDVVTGHGSPSNANLARELVKNFGLDTAKASDLVQKWTQLWVDRDER